MGGFYPMMQQFWKALGGRGTITFYDRGWYTSAVQRMLYTQFGEVKIKNGNVLHPRATVARAVRRGRRRSATSMRCAAPLPALPTSRSSSPTTATWWSNSSST